MVLSSKLIGLDVQKRNAFNLLISHIPEACFVDQIYILHFSFHEEYKQCKTLKTIVFGEHEISQLSDGKHI